MRKFLFALVLLLGVAFFITRLAEVEAILETLQQGDWRYIFLALVVQLTWLVNVAASYRTIYQTLGVEEKIESLFFIAAGANFANIVAPTGGMSGVAVFVSEAKKRGYSPARATLAGVLYVLYDYAGFLCVLSLGLIVLFRRDNLNSAELVASAILVVLAAALASMLFIGMRSADVLGAILARIARLINQAVWPFWHRQYLSEQRAIAFAHDAADGLREIRRHPRNLYLPITLALSNKTLLILVLFLMFMAFKVPISIGTLIAGFSISYLFLIVSPTPAGLGFVEGALTLALSSMYVPLGAAAVMTMAYRGITFWVPLALGGMALRLLNRSG